MLRFKHGTRLISALLALLLCAGSLGALLFPVVADELDELNSQYSSLEEQLKKSQAAYAAAQAKLADNETLLAELQKQTDALQAQYDILKEQRTDLEAKIAASNAKLQELAARVASTQSSIEENTAEKERMEGEIESATNLFMERMRANYMAGDTTWLEVLFEANSLQDYLTRTELFARVAEYDRNLVEGLKAQKENLDGIIKRLAEKKIELQAQQQEAEQVRNRLTGEKKDLDENIAKCTAKQKELDENTEAIKTNMEELSKNSAAYLEQQKRISEQQKALEDEIAKAIAERASRRKAEEEAAAKQAAASGSGLIFPLLPGQSWQQGDTYGHRINPYTLQPGFHNGTDLIVPRGTPVRAMAAGTAIIAHYSSSFGYYIMLDHGNGLLTLYAHATRLLINEGDTVEQGQQIMLVGSTGYSTGPHLHIEVHIQEADGSTHTVDPFAGYVPKP